MNDKQKRTYLRRHYPFSPVPDLDDRKLCIHCEREICVGDFKLVDFGVGDLITCPNYPDCDGTCIDWVEVPHGP
jgi:hypothetical protein